MRGISARRQQTRSGNPNSEANFFAIEYNSILRKAVVNTVKNASVL
jgi:hypothetical protein